jgi:hypothetical protein
MTQYESYINKKAREYGDKFDASELDPKFIPYFNSGQRIEVDFGYAIKRGTVGVTSGWKPVFLLMLTLRSSGSSYILDKDTTITKVI